MPPGGKFANGAVSAAFVHLFNDEAPHINSGGLGTYLSDSWMSLRDGVSNYFALSLGEMLQQSAGAAIGVVQGNQIMSYAPNAPPERGPC